MRRFTALALGAAAIGLVAAVPGCGKDKQEKARQSSPVVTGVTVTPVVSGPVSDLMEAVGTVKARNYAVIAARIPGSVISVLVREGERVPKGRLLATLASTESVAGAAGAQAAVDEARRGLDESVARKKLADTTFERYKNLLNEQAVTRQEFDAKQMEKEVADQGVERARARLAQAQETARASATIAGYTRIAAPLAGVVTGKSVDMGMTVFPGMQLMTVEEEGRYRLEVNSPASLMGKVKPGDVVAVTLHGLPDTQGRVSEVIPSADPVTRTFPVKIDISAAGIRSGLYGSAFFPVGQKQGILIPSQAIVNRGALTSVWVVGQDSIARMRLVKTGRAFGDKVEILSGITDGDRIVTAGIEKVTDGVRVQQ